MTNDEISKNEKEKENLNLQIKGMKAQIVTLNKLLYEEIQGKINIATKLKIYEEHYNDLMIENKDIKLKLEQLDEKKLNKKIK